MNRDDANIVPEIQSKSDVPAALIGGGEVARKDAHEVGASVPERFHVEVIVFVRAVY